MRRGFCPDACVGSLQLIAPITKPWSRDGRSNNTFTTLRDSAEDDYFVDNRVAVVYDDLYKEEKEVYEHHAIHYSSGFSQFIACNMG
jgi:hypothetical protein